MRVLHFLWGLAQGGAENLAVDLANEQRRDHQVTVLVANEAIDNSLVGRLHSSVRLVHLKRPEGSRNPLWIARLLANIHSLRPDVVHSHANNLAALWRFISAPLVLTVHANNVQLSRHASRFSAICCISQAVEDDIRQRYPTLAPVLVLNGIQTSAIAVRVGPFAKPLRAVQVSRLVHSTKGQDLLIDALAIVNAGGSEPQLTVDFIGDGSSRDYLQELAKSRNVSKCCNFRGAMTREEVFANLKYYDLLIQPSRDEGFGLTVAEGMAAGLPVLVSDLPGPMEVIGQGQHGNYFKSEDPAALAEALGTMISDIEAGGLEPRLAAARQYVIDEYDLVRTSDNYMRCYMEVTNVNQ